MSKKQIIAGIILLCSWRANAQQYINRMIRDANALYEHQQYEQAEAAYNKVLERNSENSTAKFNLANTLFRRSKKDDAVKLFDNIASNETDPALRSKAYYNKAVVLTRQDKLEECIEAYKSALRLNPGDNEARENLQKALLELKKKQPPKKKQDDSQKKKKQNQQNKQQQQPRPKMNQQEAEQRLKLMEQKEKEVLQRMQREKAKTGNVLAKDW
jgi:tetratricopeptide (TPR) repeat protein